MLRNGSIDQLSKENKHILNVIKKLKEQFEGLKNQIEQLNQAKGNMDNYYTNQISELKGQLIALIKENNNLRDNNQLIENDFIS